METRTGKSVTSETATACDNRPIRVPAEKSQNNRG